MHNRTEYSIDSWDKVSLADGETNAYSHLHNKSSISRENILPFNVGTGRLPI
jgi:hypothetical protein